MRSGRLQSVRRSRDSGIPPHHRSPEHIPGPTSCARSLSRDTTVTRILRARGLRKRADQIVRFVFIAGELGYPRWRQNSRHSANWRLSCSGAASDWPCSGIQLVPKRLAVALIEGNRNILGRRRSSRSPRKRAKRTEHASDCRRDRPDPAASSARREIRKRMRRSDKPLWRRSLAEPAGDASVQRAAAREVRQQYSI